jgi:hypothetical protein
MFVYNKHDDAVDSDIEAAEQGAVPVNDLSPEASGDDEDENAPTDDDDLESAAQQKPASNAQTEVMDELEEEAEEELQDDEAATDQPLFFNDLFWELFSDKFKPEHDAIRKSLKQFLEGSTQFFKQVVDPTPMDASTLRSVLTALDTRHEGMCAFVGPWPDKFGRLTWYNALAGLDMIIQLYFWRNTSRFSQQIHEGVLRVAGQAWREHTTQGGGSSHSKRTLLSQDGRTSAPATGNLMSIFQLLYHMRVLGY